MFNTFNDCFVAREATQFLVREGICSTRFMAVKLMTALVSNVRAGCGYVVKDAWTDDSYSL